MMKYAKNASGVGANKKRHGTHLKRYQGTGIPAHE